MKLFVLEDDIGTIKLYDIIFSNAGLRYDLACNIQEALRLLSRNKYYLYLLDVKIGNSQITGADLLKLGIGPVIFVSGYDLSNSHVQSLRKPVKPDLLLKTIRQYRACELTTATTEQPN